MRELGRIRVLERVLILRAADTVLDREVLNRLHIERDALNVLQLRLQAADDLRCVGVALIERLQIDLNAPDVRGHVRAVDADERGDARDGGILRHDLGQLQLAIAHR